VSVGTLVKRASVALDRVVPPPHGVTVLIYHRVGGGSGGAVDLDPEQFDRQLAHLAAHHRVLRLGEALAELGDPDQGRAAAVVVTFDDGTADFVDHAVPALTRHRIPATLYVATRFVEEQEDFPWGAPPASWAGLAEAVASGWVDIGSHTHDHRLLDRAGGEGGAVAADLDRSIELIRDRLGVDPLDFAYPKALPGSPAAEVAVRRRFRSAALAGSRVNRPGGTDLHRIMRTPIQRSDGVGWFEAKAAGGLRLEGAIRATVARARYRGAVT